MAGARKKAGEEPVIKTYKVLTPLKDGDSEFAPGEPVEMLTSDAAELVAIGALADPEA